MGNKELIDMLIMSGKLDKKDFLVNKSVNNIYNWDSKEIYNYFMKFRIMNMPIGLILRIIDALFIVRDYSDDFIEKIVEICIVLERAIINKNYEWEVFIDEILFKLAVYDIDVIITGGGITRYKSHIYSESEILRNLRKFTCGNVDTLLTRLDVKDGRYTKRVYLKGVRRVVDLINKDTQEIYEDIGGFSINKDLELRIYKGKVVNFNNDGIVLVQF